MELLELAEQNGLAAAIKEVYRQDDSESVADDDYETKDSIGEWIANESCVIEPVDKVQTFANRLYEIDPQWLIQDLIPTEGFGQIYGRDGTGKTYLALDLALSVANWSISEWFGYPIRRHGEVLYVTMEGSYSFPYRVQSWLQHHEEVTDERLLTWPEWPLDLTDTASTANLASRIVNTNLFGKIVQPVLIIIDTQRLASSGNEDSSEYGKALTSNVRELANGFGAAVVLVHHSSAADKRERGTTAVRDACQFQFGLKKIKGEGVRAEVYQLKNKYGPTKGESAPLFSFEVAFEQLKIYSVWHTHNDAVWESEYGEPYYKDGLLITRYGSPVIDGYAVPLDTRHALADAVRKYQDDADIAIATLSAAGELTRTELGKALGGRKETQGGRVQALLDEGVIVSVPDKRGRVCLP